MLDTVELSGFALYWVVHFAVTFSILVIFFISLKIIILWYIFNKYIFGIKNQFSDKQKKN